MLYKLRNNRRHKFNKVHYKITNWPEYNEALKQRGSITLWLSPEIIKAWYTDKNKPKQQGRQCKYSNIAIFLHISWHGVIYLESFEKVNKAFRFS